MHVLHVWMVATLKGGQPASKGGASDPPPPPNETLMNITFILQTYLSQHACMF